MSEPKFTPGPWFVMGNEIGTQEMALASVSLGVQIRFGHKQNEANARLIAAAPEMYTLLNEFVLDYEDCPKEIIDDECLQGNELMIRIKSAINVISKVKGEK